MQTPSSKDTLAHIAHSTVTPAFLLGTEIQGLIMFNNPGYVPHQWHGTLLGWAMLAIPIVSNLVSTKILEPLEIVGGIMNFAMLVVTVLVLAILSPRSPAEFVFATSIFGESGWENKGIQWCIGLLPAAFTLSGNSPSCHTTDTTDSVQDSMVLFT
jgi:choline transport protein